MKSEWSQAWRHKLLTLPIWEAETEGPKAQGQHGPWSKFKKNLADSVRTCVKVKQYKRELEIYWCVWI